MGRLAEYLSRQRLAMILCVVFSLLLWAVSSLLVPVHAEELDVWLGTTTPRGGPSRGIYYVSFDTESGELSESQLAAEIDGPRFLAMHTTKDVLYSVCRVDGEGSVSAFQIERRDGHPKLKPINSQPIGDEGYAHLCVDQTGLVLMTAQYGGGSVAVFPLGGDGAIRPRVQLIKHTGGSGAVKGRQDSPHPHWIGVDRANRFVFVPDLGADRVVIYRLNASKPELLPHGHADLPPGSGPRHMKLHANLPFAYVLNEVTQTVTVFGYNAESGTLTDVQTIEVLPDRLKEGSDSASEIRIHSSGRFLYTANRGHDSIAVFRINSKDGRLSFVELESVRGSWPRSFDLTPDGRWLLAAGRDSNTLAVFRINNDAGDLVFSRRIVNTPSAICVLVDQP